MVTAVLSVPRVNREDTALISAAKHGRLVPAEEMAVNAAPASSV